MKKALRWGVLALGVVVGLALLAVVVLEVRGIPRYPRERVELKVEVTPARVARGKKWATMLCAECHADPTTLRLTGKRLVDAPPEFGAVYSKNITQDPVKGIGAWTDGELAYFLRTGIRRDGQYVPPPMPKLQYMSDDDLQAIIAFLRSDDPLVAAADVDDRDSEPSLLVKLLCVVAFKPRPWPKASVDTPSRGDVLAYGKYLSDNMQCFECHSKDFKTNRDPPESSDGYMGGGNMLLDLAGKKIWSPNLTSDEKTGIGKWSDAQFRRAIRDGFRPDDSPIVYPMPKWPELSDEELNALYAYLKTVPKISNARPDAERVAPTGLTGGEAIYVKQRCDACHGASGVGVADLRKGPARLTMLEQFTAYVKNPRATYPDVHMPPYDGVIKEEEYAPLYQHVKSLATR